MDGRTKQALSSAHREGKTKQIRNESKIRSRGSAVICRVHEVKLIVGRRASTMGGARRSTFVAHMRATMRSWEHCCCNVQLFNNVYLVQSNVSTHKKRLLFRQKKYTLETRFLFIKKIKFD